MVTSNNRKNASFWIKKLQLSQHPEGGFNRKIYRADIEIDFYKESENKQKVASENVARSTGKRRIVSNSNKTGTLLECRLQGSRFVRI
jgi:hypothetical protein